MPCSGTALSIWVYISVVNTCLLGDEEASAQAFFFKHKFPVHPYFKIFVHLFWSQRFFYPFGSAGGGT